MAERAEWTVEYYVDDSGGVPVREFFATLDEQTYGRLLAGIELLRVRNVAARPPLVRHLEGKLWELREESRTNIFRVLYVFFTGRRIVLLHAFQKKQQKLPRQELATALARYHRFLAREGGDDHD